MNFLSSIGKLQARLANIPQDKLLHSFYGTLIYTIVSFVNPVIAIIVVLIVAISKEVLDEIRYKGFDYMDILVTVILPYLLYLKEVFYG